MDRLKPCSAEGKDVEDEVADGGDDGEPVAPEEMRIVVVIATAFSSFDIVANVAVVNEHAKEVEGCDEDHPFPHLAQADLAHGWCMVFFAGGGKEGREVKKRKCESGPG